MEAKPGEERRETRRGKAKADDVENGLVPTPLITIAPERELG